MTTFGSPVQLAPGLMAMWGNRLSCTFSKKHNLDNFAVTTEEKFSTYKLDSLWYLQQEHTAEGKILKAPLDRGLHRLSEIGDYLITNEVNAGISVITADCVPMIFFDPVKKVIAVAHAGWRGTVQGIAPIVVRQMCMRFGSDIDQLRTWVGPHARSCCYEVKEEFRSNLLESIIDLVLFERDGKLFFDTFKYNEQLLLAVGIKVEQIDSSYSLCTMCNIQFHSRRNDGALYIGQSSIAWLV